MAPIALARFRPCVRRLRAGWQVGSRGRSARRPAGRHGSSSFLVAVEGRWCSLADDHVDEGVSQVDRILDAVFMAWPPAGLWTWARLSSSLDNLAESVERWAQASSQHGARRYGDHPCRSDGGSDLRLPAAASRRLQGPHRDRPRAQLHADADGSRWQDVSWAIQPSTSGFSVPMSATVSCTQPSYAFGSGLIP